VDIYLYARADMESDTTLRRVGEHMKRARERAGLTQGHVATRMGPEIDQPRVSKWERGAAQPSILQLFRFAEICGVAPEELVGEILKPLAQQATLFRDLDPPATRLVTNLVSLLHERTRLLRARGARERRRNG
jgi:transcriptional regulator with XRE-family HTH domain